jgi:hypothetical protein
MNKRLTIFRSRKVAALLTLLALLAGAAPARAGDDVRLHDGARVRLVPRDGARDPIVGTVAEADDQGLTLRHKGDDHRWSWSEIDALYVSIGKRAHVETGTRIGVVAVGIPFAVLGAAASTLCVDFNGHESVTVSGERCGGPVDVHAVVGSFALGALAGGLLGAAVGAVIPGESWRRVDTPRSPQLSLGIQPQRGGLGVRVALRF